MTAEIILLGVAGAGQSHGGKGLFPTSRVAAELRTRTPRIRGRGQRREPRKKMHIPHQRKLPAEIFSASNGGLPQD